MPQNVTDPELEALIQKLIARLNTPEGQEALEQAARDAQAFSEEMAEKRRIDWRTVFEPVTI